MRYSPVSYVESTRDSARPSAANGRASAFGAPRLFRVLGFTSTHRLVTQQHVVLTRDIRWQYMCCKRSRADRGQIFRSSPGAYGGRHGSKEVRQERREARKEGWPPQEGWPQEGWQEGWPQEAARRPT